MTDWRKSKRSFANGNCSDIASGVKIRDNKDRNGVALKRSPDIWRAFIRQVKQ
jgi:Domain of unknown function (DUF397)